MIIINKNFRIDADENQYVVKEYHEIQDENSKRYGEETYTVEGYYGTLENAIRGIEKALARRAIQEKDYGLKEFIENLREIHKDIFRKTRMIDPRKKAKYDK